MRNHLLDKNISVIIPVYNAEKYLHKAIESVLIQSEVKELILVDDGSTDNSLLICSNYKNKDERIKVFAHPKNKNKGVSATRNVGIKSATCEYIAFLDADDYYLPERFKETKKCFMDETVDGVYEMIGVFNEKNTLVNYCIINTTEPENLFENLSPIGFSLWFSSNGVTFKKKLFEKTGLFDEKLKVAEDTFQWFKAASVGKIIGGNIKTPVAVVNRGHISLTSNKSLFEKGQSLMLFKIFQWAKKKRLSFQKKELILKRIIQQTLDKDYENNFYRYPNMACTYLRVFLISPAFILFHSKSSRILLYTLLGYNRLKITLKDL